MSDYGGRLIRDTEPTVNTTSASGIWTIEEALKYKKAGTWPTPVYADPNFKQTVLLLHGDGTNGAQNNTFLDSSTNNFTITRNGNTTQGTFSPFSVGAGEWSNYFDGSGDYLTIGNNAAFDFGSGDFTLEAWVNIGSSTGSKTIFAKTFDFGPFILTVDGVTVKYYLSSTGSSWNIASGVSGGTVSVGSWFHVALVRNGNTVTPYVNGVAGTTTTTSATLATNTRVLSIGAAQTSSSTFVDNFNGYLSNARIVKGTAVYTSNFTPSTTPLTAITNTSLLTCQSNRFVDNSTNSFAITRNGDVRVTPFSPFQPLLAYSPGVTGGSGYFNGNTDYLRTSGSNAAFQFSGDFTFECWFYSTSATAQMIFDTVQPGISGGGTSRICFFVNSNRTVSFFNVSQYTTSNTINFGDWNYLVLTRSGSTQKIFINGVEGYSGTHTNNYSSGYCTIGFDSALGGTIIMNGYLSDCRVLKGTGYSSVTVPTAPLTAITNTSLLLNFTNAGIFDQTGKNVLETVGNAQVDTSVKKFGTGSMKFDPGQTNPLVIPHTDLFNLSSGDFTIEFWVYLNADRTFNYVISKGGALTREWAVNVGPTNLRFYWSTNGSSTGDSVVSGSATLPLSTWMHIAVTRAGNSIRLFKDGTQVGSTGTFTSMYSGTGSVYVGRFMDYNNISHDLIGYIDDLRITKGVARYTANFTAPTAPFLDQ